MALGRETEIHMVSDWKRLDWGDVVRMEEGNMVDVTLRLRGGGGKNPWNPESDTVKRERQRSPGQK